MSYILDALRKIEHEKNKKVQPDGRVNISGDLFLERNRPGTRTSYWKVAALVVAASMVTCAGTWFVLKGNSKKNGAIIRPLVALSPVSTAQPVASPAISTPPRTQPVPVAVQIPSPKRVEAAGGNNVSPSQEVRHPEKRPTMAPARMPKQTAQLVPAPADIKLSGIAWQDERAARRAVVNGFLLKEGAVVSGATIVEIQATKVRFVSAAGQFEIALDAVLPAGGTR